MPELFLNPNLPNYFIEAPEVTSEARPRSYVSEYENAQVITFPNLKANIDHEFWAAIDTDRYPALKKFSAMVMADHRDVEQHRRNLLRYGVDEGLAAALCDQFQAMYDALIPTYDAIFADYEFDRRKVVWRLNTIMNENLHVDLYKEENEQHFARMFINLDNQPRIWQTSWRIQDMVRLVKGKIAPEELEGLSRGEVWARINNSFFGRSSSEWWDNQPRHVAYFAPGDIWVVDSRQVAHQIFYGRRALSIDFSLPMAQMKNADVHYLNIAERFRALNLAAAST